MARGFSCSAEGGIFLPRPGVEAKSPALESGFSNTGPREGPRLHVNDSLGLVDCLVVLERVKWTGKWGSRHALSPGPLPDPLAIIGGRRGGGPAIHSNVQGTLTSLVTEGRKMLSWARSRIVVSGWWTHLGEQSGAPRFPPHAFPAPSPICPLTLKAEGWPQLPKEAFGLQSSAV